MKLEPQDSVIAQQTYKLAGKLGKVLNKCDSQAGLGALSVVTINSIFWIGREKSDALFEDYISQLREGYKFYKENDQRLKGL